MEVEHCPRTRLILREGFHKDFVDYKLYHTASSLMALPQSWLLPSPHCIHLHVNGNRRGGLPQKKRQFFFLSYLLNSLFQVSHLSADFVYGIFFFFFVYGIFNTQVYMFSMINFKSSNIFLRIFEVKSGAPKVQHSLFPLFLMSQF